MDEGKRKLKNIEDPVQNSEQIRRDPEENSGENARGSPGFL